MAQVVTSNPVTVLAECQAKDAALPDAVFSSIKYTYMKPPLCFISTGDHAVNLTPRDLLVVKHQSYCRCPVKYGAGYNAFLAPLRKLYGWRINSSKFVCGAPKYSFNATVSDGYAFGADLAPKADGEAFAKELHHAVAGARGLPVLRGGESSANFQSGSCVRNARLAILPTGGVSLVERQAGCTTLTNTTTGFLQDLNYIRFTKATLLGSVFCGHKNRMEVSLAGDKLYMSLALPAARLPEAHDTVLRTLRGNVADLKTEPVLAQYEARGSEATIRPGFVTITTNPRRTFGLCDQEEVTTVLASKISHLRADLPSWQHALVKAVRDIELAAMAKLCGQMCTNDMVTLTAGNPIPVAANFYAFLILAFKAVLSVVAFLMVLFCRKTSVIFGGSGPAGAVHFTPAEKPEALLQEISANVASAAAAYVSGPAPDPECGHAKPTAVKTETRPEGMSIAMMNPMRTKSEVAAAKTGPAAKAL